MTDEIFRSLALSFAGVREGSHMGRADFRVGAGAGKIFASLESPDEGWVMLRLPQKEQERVLRDDSLAARAANGAWGAAGCTHLRLSSLPRATGLKLLKAAVEFRLAESDTKKAVSLPRKASRSGRKTTS
ncbi:MAG: hypothetical protein IBJ18_02370 [Phycisphaerales bacterium]|nr:hypothetical protein [Phycisphaerales bacterium]